MIPLLVMTIGLGQSLLDWDMPSVINNCPNYKKVESGSYEGPGLIPEQSLLATWGPKFQLSLPISTGLIVASARCNLLLRFFSSSFKPGSYRPPSPSFLALDLFFSLFSSTPWGRLQEIYSNKGNDVSTSLLLTLSQTA